MIRLSQIQFDTIYSRLGVKFDFALGESFYNPWLGEVVDDLLAKKIARESEGAVGVFSDGSLPPKEDPFLVNRDGEWIADPALVRKSDGGFNYTTTDLATVDYRLKTWSPDEIVYVVDDRQSGHFKKLFLIVARWKPDAAKSTKLIHVGFGKILGDDGKPFKTRSGDTVKLGDLLDEAEARAFKIVSDYVASGLSRYGGDDGLTIYKRSTFGGLINLSNRVQFYYLCLFCLFSGIFLVWRIVNSRFGLVLQGLRSNEQRMQAIGFPVTRYRLVCFIISGTMCGLAGALLANNTDFISPAVMYWTCSGDLMVMVILGGMGSLFGPVVGAIVYLVLEEFLSQVTEYWAMIMGPLLLLIVLFGRGGIMGLIGRFSRG